MYIQADIKVTHAHTQHPQHSAPNEHTDLHTHTDRTVTARATYDSHIYIHRRVLSPDTNTDTIILS